MNKKIRGSVRLVFDVELEIEDDGMIVESEQLETAALDKLAISPFAATDYMSDSTVVVFAQKKVTNQ